MSDTTLIELKTFISDKASHDQLKYWCKLQGIRPIVKARIAHVSIAESERIQEMIALVSSGMTPKEAARKLGNTKEEAGHLVTAPTSPVLQELKEIREAMLAMAQEVKASREENRALRSEVLSLQKCLEYKKPEAAAMVPQRESPISSESQDRRADPREGSPAKSDFWKELQKVSAWLEGVVSPFVQVFKG